MNIEKEQKKTSKRLIWIIIQNENDIYIFSLGVRIWFGVRVCRVYFCFSFRLFFFLLSPYRVPPSNFFQQQWWYRNRKKVPTSVTPKRRIETKSDLNAKKLSHAEYVAEHCALCIFHIYCIKLIKFKEKRFSSHFDLFFAFLHGFMSMIQYKQWKNIKKELSNESAKVGEKWKVVKCEWKLAKESKEKKAKRQQGL